MNIAPARRYELGRFTIQERPRPDSPAWPVYIVILRGVEVGRSFSKPDEGCCEWLLTHPDGVYTGPAQSAPWNYNDIQVRYKKRGRPTKEEAAARQSLTEPEPVT